MISVIECSGGEIPMESCQDKDDDDFHTDFVLKLVPAESVGRGDKVSCHFCKGHSVTGKHLHACFLALK